MTPDPGTPEAIRTGCICPDYNHQPAQPSADAIKRFGFIDSTFLVNSKCPIHGWQNV